MILAAHQPQYLPWLGYLHKNAGADVFLILDDVQYKKNEWQNRNRIKSAEGWQWVTVPVTYRFPERIREVGVDRGAPWRRKHREALVSSYARTPHFDEVMAAVSFIWEDPRGWEWLWALNLRVIRAFLEMGGIVTPLRLASDFSLPADPSRRLIEVRFQKFECPRYDQVFGEFIPNFSAIDYFFHHGPAASRSFFTERQES